MFNNKAYYSISITGGGYNNVLNNYINNGSLISVTSKSIGNRISNNLITNGNENAYAIDLQNTSNNIVYGNRIYNHTAPYTIETVKNSSNNYFYNNTLFNCTKFVCIYDDLSFNNTYENNTLDYFSKAFTSYNSSYIVYKGNYLNRSVTNYDGWNLGFEIDKGSHDILIDGNYLYEMGTLGALIRYVNNITIINNYVDLLPRNQIFNYKGMSGLDPRCGWFVSELYESYTNDMNDNQNIGSVSGKRSNNITIKSNIYGDNVECYIRTQGTTNFVHDLTDFWFINQQFPTYLVERDNFYLNNEFENLSIKNNNSIFTDRLLQAFEGQHFLDVTYKLHKDWQFYQNDNLTVSKILDRGNLTNSLIYLSNGSLPCGGGNLLTGDCNVTLAPNNWTYALSNYNITEGVTREHDPLWITQESAYIKHIKSNLSQMVKAPTYISFDCDNNVLQARYTSDSGSQDLYFTRNEFKSRCNNDMFYLGELNIDPSTTSNIIEILSTTNRFSYFAQVLVFILDILPILGIILTYVVFKQVYIGKIKVSIAISLIIAEVIIYLIVNMLINEIVGVI